MQSELHRHLDVSLRLSTLLRLAQERGIEAESTSLARFAEKIQLRKPLNDLSTVLATFVLFQHVLDRPDVLEQVAYEVVEDCWLEGTRLVELRFSPSFVCQLSKLRWIDALDGFHAGMTRALAKYPEMKAGLICIASRDYGPDAVEETIEFFLKNRDRLIGVDLAGPEIEFPGRLFEKSFARALDAGAAITIHAGEAAGPDSIWEAIDHLGARRIGHGISAILDPTLMEQLRIRGICLEMCPTSNWLTQAIPTFAAHPLPHVLRAGVPVCLNTDDPAVFATSMPQEIEVCRKHLGMTQAEIETCFEHGRKSSFIV